ncbi:PQQ-binding-like beta-propeller repeat protein [Planctomicrobium sp. SH661]|uniref:PQQ-binding-like beta-propeller repeat protein n=1 Tax=Planctomicrobium sp. SH661 TaxID=3448124 RepID=UPI003F5B547A
MCNNRNFIGLLVFVCSAACSCVISAADPEAGPANNWPQWRGPHADGTVPAGNPPIEWSETKNIKWKIEVPGRGSSTPVVWGDKMFVLTAILTDKPIPAGAASPKPALLTSGTIESPSQVYDFCVLCYDRETGRELWRQVATSDVPHEGGHPTNSLASGSPITNGKHLYASFGSYGIFCYDLDGNLIWKQDLGDMETRRGFGEGGSPALHGDHLIVPWDHEKQSKLFALNALTGEIRWEKERDEPTTWVTPLIVEHAGRHQVITNGTNRARSYDLETGELIWECGGQFTNPIASPVALNDIVYCMTGYNGFAVYAIPLSSQGDITDSDKIAWRRNDAGPYISSPVISSNTLYFTKSRDAILYAVDPLTGKNRAGEKRLPRMGTLYASPIAVDGRLYYCDRSGTTTVLKDSPEMEVLATNLLEDVLDASPVVIGKQLFLRGEKSLYCIEE